MYIARSEWNSYETGEYIGCSKDYEKLVEKVMKWVKDTIENDYADFSNYDDIEEIEEELRENGCVQSRGAYTYHDDSLDADDWVCYMIDSVDEL